MSYTQMGWAPTDFFTNDYGDFVHAYLAQRATLLRVAGQRPEPGPNNKALPWTNVDRANEIVRYWVKECEREDLLNQVYSMDQERQYPVIKAIGDFKKEYPKYFTTAALDGTKVGGYLSYDSTVSFWDMIARLALQLQASSVLPSSSDLWVESIMESLPTCLTNPKACMPAMPAWMKWATIGTVAVGAMMLLKKR